MAPPSPCAQNQQQVGWSQAAGYRLHLHSQDHLPHTPPGPITGPETAGGQWSGICQAGPGPRVLPAGMALSHQRAHCLLSCYLPLWGNLPAAYRAGGRVGSIPHRFRNKLLAPKHEPTQQSWELG